MVGALISLRCSARLFADAGGLRIGVGGLSLGVGGLPLSWRWRFASFLALVVCLFLGLGGLPLSWPWWFKNWIGVGLSLPQWLLVGIEFI
jgi:hypothetical protein